jgi:MinD superfamily P-loop ATPase
MKQLVVLSGKGGTGKTSLVAAFAHLALEGELPISTVLADADVDAANLELVLTPSLIEQEDFWGGQVACIDPLTCAGCGDCVEVCRFDAILAAEDRANLRQPGSATNNQDCPEGDAAYYIDPIACDGCAACVYRCPTGSIRMIPQIAGKWFHSQSRYGPLHHAELHPAQENSGKLVTLVKQRARLQAMDENHDLVLVDGPPGTGCPVISAASGADLALIVAEPTIAGVHDMQRVLETTGHFGVRSLVCVNKADIYPPGTQQIRAYCQEQEIDFVGAIPFDPSITAAMVQGQPVTAYCPGAPASLALRQIWEEVLAALQGV